MSQTLGDAVGEFQRRLERFGQPLLRITFHAKPVDHGFNGVFFVFIQRWRAIEIHHQAVDARADEAACHQFFEHVEVLSFALGDYRRQHHDAFVCG